MPFEDEFSHALREAAEASPPTSVELLAIGAAQRGRRRKRRRTVVASASAMAAMACVGVLTLQLRPSADVSSPSTVGTTADPATPAATRKLPPLTPVPAPVTSGQLLELFKAELPADLRLSNAMTQDGSAGGSVQLTAAYTATDGHHTGGVEINLTRAPAHPGQRASVGPCSGGIPDCTTTAEPGGASLSLYLPAQAAGGEQNWTATLDRPDGSALTISAGNIPGPGSGRDTPYPNAPLLSAAQLTALALDPVWQPLMANPGGTSTAG
ncbi:hypothetical protein P3T36_004104 [Kitasatospora sp. MAP12-15]|uniref:hypothetical protein n=1 Tax=unclassified Kitasatospora TaxID=2633591 RepID=UPI00247664AC|nr:hypothetical protein [Kitasatospora sp. MAP12-44]MDH6115185.1 hypothetical protein [Kitasatospora sp. MAP12-44]